MTENKISLAETVSKWNLANDHFKSMFENSSSCIVFFFLLAHLSITELISRKIKSLIFHMFLHFLYLEIMSRSTRLVSCLKLNIRQCFCKVRDTGMCKKFRNLE